MLTLDEAADFFDRRAVPAQGGGSAPSIFHHCETLHHWAPNTTGQPRLALPMEFQLTPARRQAPVKMPWVDERRAAVGRVGPALHVADGKVYQFA